MTIDDAIENLQRIDTPLSQALYPKDIYAIRLGIEALKREQINREEGVYLRVELLPGETEE